MPGGRKQLLLWIAAAVIASAVLITVLIWERRPEVARRALYVVGVPERGAMLFYGQKQCSVCHSINGSGGRIAPDLSATRPGTPAMGWLGAVLWNHAPGMFRQIRSGKSYPQLNTGEMADILAFLYQAGNVDRPGDPVAGRRAFREKGCVQCHAVRSEGGKSAPDLATVALAGGSNEWMRAMWNHTQSMIDPISKALGHWPQFTGSEMNDLVAYVGEGNQKARASANAGSAELGWKVFQARCIQCHSVRGNGGKLGPELGPEHDLPLTTAAFASELWNHAPAMLRLGRENGTAMPTLQRDEMADLAAFLASLRYVEPTGSSFVGERVFSVRGCAQCHGPEADGTRLGPRLRAGDDAYTAVSFTAALWKHGPRMVDRVEEMGISWPTLEATDIGDLVAFLNVPRRQK
jgi:mono/diheme cytochrome c family protein